MTKLLVLLLGLFAALCTLLHLGERLLQLARARQSLRRHQRSRFAHGFSRLQKTAYGDLEMELAGI